MDINRPALSVKFQQLHIHMSKIEAMLAHRNDAAHLLSEDKWVWIADLIDMLAGNWKL